jgi:hypothetical protein
MHIRESRMRCIALLAQVRKNDVPQVAVRDFARQLTGASIAEVTAPAGYARSHRCGIWPRVQHRFVVICFEEEHVEITECVADALRGDPKVIRDARARSTRSRRRNQDDRLGRIMGCSHRKQVHISNCEAVPRSKCNRANVGEVTTGCYCAGCRIGFPRESLAQHAYSTNVIRVFVRDDDRLNRLGCYCSKSQALDESGRRESSIDE